MASCGNPVFLCCTVGTPIKEPSILDSTPTPQLKGAAEVPAMRASPLLVPSSNPGSLAPRNSSPLSSSPGSQHSSKTGRSPGPRVSSGSSQQRSYSSQHLNTARIAKVTRNPNYTRDQSSPSSSSPSGGMRRRPVTAKSSPEKGRRTELRASPGPRSSSRPATAGRGRGVLRQSRLSVQTPAQASRSMQASAGLEEKPVKGSSTPFDVRQGSSYILLVV